MLQSSLFFKEKFSPSSEDTHKHEHAEEPKQTGKITDGVF